MARSLLLGDPTIFFQHKGHPNMNGFHPLREYTCWDYLHFFMVWRKKNLTSTGPSGQPDTRPVRCFALRALLGTLGTQVSCLLTRGFDEH